jgi:hypothetical protein
MAIGFLLMWVVFVLLVNHLARESKNRIGWTVAASCFPFLLIVLTGRVAQMFVPIALFGWGAVVVQVNYLARENKHRIGWTVAAGWFGIFALFAFLIVEAINHNRLEKLDAAGGKISGGQLRS